ncbi:phosphoadenosine phosphosulfate reductase [Buchnera aphidicola (Melanaphis sacchari)]|uniref:Phosphoadenosine 5'-phosphosulfate reductase n=1 Tax=Buchnera aphidicola (Melanaphis sacchari) TaxID=2173854 RepID=A0A2U8DGF7_9GAMM|nr:phosphoadenylyl-sulfate reductase [Buchnera aphidicola]AWH90374.1 phosphoadenosine phosphosulfate reductase [Buchnera aphidicola (Melanaphis sacchari)]
MFNYKNINLFNNQKKRKILLELNELMSTFSAKKRISWSLRNLPTVHVMSSSFGIQSIVLLHLMITEKSDIPIILIDTGYLFPQTYQFIDMLTRKWHLNIKIFRSKISPAWQEARYGKLWEKGIEGIDFYNTLNKVKPMNVALKKLSVNTWFSGLRHEQSKSRSLLPYVSINRGIFKILPILDWSNHKINTYLKDNNLDYHPLFQEGYVSIGDVHTTKKYKKGMLEEETRFFGLKRECGLHNN